MVSTSPETHPRERLESEMEMAARLAGGVAHDLNNILTPILGFGALLAEHVAHDPEASRSVREVLAAAERGAQLAQDLLVFSGRQLLSPRVALAPDIVAGALPDLRRVLGDDVEIQVKSGRDLPPLRVDVEAFIRALCGLARHAREAMPDGGTFAIETAEAGDFVRFLVRDSSGGLPPETTARLFEPFHRATPRGAQAGLRLSLVHGFVAQSRGRLSVESVPGRGTTFTLDMPVQTD